MSGPNRRDTIEGAVRIVRHVEWVIADNGPGRETRSTLTQLESETDEEFGLRIRGEYRRLGMPQRRGRPKGAGALPFDVLLSAFRDLHAELGGNPTKAQLAARLTLLKGKNEWEQVSEATIDRTLKHAARPWPPE